MTNPDDRVYPIYDGNSITKRELFAALRPYHPEVAVLVLGKE